MPILKLQWWLGNQMFGYALAYALSKEKGEPILLDPFVLENRFIWANWTFRNFELEVFWIKKEYQSPPAFISRYIHPELIAFWNRIRYGKRYIKEKWGKVILQFPKHTYLDGWFQSYQYFEKYTKDIQEIFTVRTPFTKPNQGFINLIEEAGNRAVSLHVRRGDYVTLEWARRWHGVCSLEYYEWAIASMKDKLENPVFFIFSDDIAWCREYLEFPEGIQVYFIDHNESAGHEDLRLMYTCSHHIIANSTFSWWGAYLGRNPDKTIIAPKKWLQTDRFTTQYIIPPSWVLL